jgi:kynurenine 3-monooxygenase
MTSRLPQAVSIVGAGLCGPLLAILLARRGLRVTLYERGTDPRAGTPAGGRSINLALAARGIRALEHAGLMDAVRPLLIPMRGRRVHDEHGKEELLPYGQREHEVIYSVSRAALNRLLTEAAAERGVTLAFGHEAVAAEAGAVHVRDHGRGRDLRLGPPVIAADGAGSAIRRELDAAAGLGATESLLPHGYKELTLPPGPNGAFRLDPHALHIWPRGGFMLIALPNPGGDFTCTLFLANEGSPGFAELDRPAVVDAFFRRWFGDVVGLIPDLAATFLRNPRGVLGTVRCRRWHAGDVLLVGDAAHAIVPFHGQGMNLAFEDCVLLDRILGKERSFRAACERFEAEQLPNANAIADMALENYVEMRDTVRDPKFALQKQLSFELERRLPDRFIPRYSMVMFHAEIPYAVAQRRGAVQQALLDELTRRADTLADIDLEAAAALARDRLPPL